MTNLTVPELAAIAVALGEEEGAERKRRRWAVHPAWSKREIEGEFVTLYKELTNDEVKFHGYFRMNRECFSALLEKVSPLLIKQRALAVNCTCSQFKFDGTGHQRGKHGKRIVTDGYATGPVERTPLAQARPVVT